MIPNHWYIYLDVFFGGTVIFEFLSIYPVLEFSFFIKGVQNSVLLIRG